MAMDTIPTGAAPRIAVVTTDESVQLAAQEVLASAFHTTLLGSGEQILPLLDEVSLEAVILDLEGVKLVDRDTVGFLASFETGQAKITNCPRYIREWIRREREQQ